MPLALVNIFLTATLQAFGVVDAVNDWFRSTLGFLG
jgi:hypothetical protein